MAEKSASQIPRPLREQYEKGLEAFQRKNFDYALSILTQVILQEPAFYECRQALRATQFKKSGDGGSFFKKMIGGAASSPLLAKAQIALRKNPAEAINTAEQILNGDPISSAAHRIVAEAALALEFPRTAILSLEILVKNSPKDSEVAMKLAEAYSNIGEIEKAESILNDLAASRPNDPILAQALKDLSARKTLSEGGYNELADGSGSYRDILKNKDEAVSLEQENRQVKDDDVASRLIREHEARLKAEPDNIKLYRTLAELHTQKKEFSKALDYYQKIIRIEGAVDASLEKAIAETTMRQADHALSELDPTSPDFEDQAARIRAERDRFLVEECESRAERYPNDLQIRFELGQVYFNASRVSEAIQEFQKAQNHPHRRIQALNYLGQCFARRGMHDLAARTLQNALKEKIVFDEEKKELIYALGSVFEKMGKASDAIEQFKHIYEIDIGYKDVAAKVDAFYEANQQR